MVDFRPQPAPLARWVLGILSGVQTGVFAAFVIVVYMAIVSVASRDPWWAYPNLLATAFYGGRALSAGPGWPTIAGIALQVVAGGIAGSVFGAVFAHTQSGSRLIVLGAVWGIAWFYILQSFYRMFARLIPVYAPEMALLGAHTVFGLILGRFARVAPPVPESETASETQPPIS